MEIDTHAASFQTFESFGLQLLANDHYASPEISDKLQTIKTERENLERSVVPKPLGCMTTKFSVQCVE